MGEPRVSDDHPQEAPALAGAATPTKLPGGHAAAAQPLAAQAIVTDTRGLLAGEVSIATVDGELTAYRALPDGPGPFALVLVVQEIFGVHEHIRDLCRRLAKLGYLAVAPDLYARQGDPARLDSVERILGEIVARVPSAQVMADLDAVVAWGVASGLADPGRLAITGFCWGGRIVWLYAAHNPGLKAGVAWYGRLDGSRSALQPQQPLDVVARLQAPILGLYGERDAGIPLDSVRRMREALEQGAVEARIVVYPGAPHGFFADYRASYRPETAALAWNEMLGWLRRHGV